ncbi:MAG: ABC transporter permease [Acidobacteriaceae bacterium]|nr:ABC transporter permease [Acidobacteriaceae bacterium]
MPDWKNVVRERFASLRLDGAAEEDLVEEVSAHLEDRYRELCGGGTSEEDAFGAAVAELDEIYAFRVNAARIRPLAAHDAVPVGDTRRANFLEDFWRDLRYAVRSLRKSPAFVIFVIATLALGIGANTTVFTVINTLILNPLPVPHSSQLIAVNNAKAPASSKSTVALPLSYADLKDIQARNTVFRAFAGYSPVHGVTWQSNNVSQGLFVETVTANYFPTLELTPAKGRFFLPEEEGSPGAHPVAVLNYGTWETRFGGAADIVGKTMQLNHVVFTVVGVAPQHFIGVNAIFGPDLWVPVSMAEQLFPNDMRSVFSDRGKGVFQGVGRLEPHRTQAEAQANLSTIAANLAREYPATNEGRTAMARPISDVLFANSSSTSTAPVIFGSAGLLIVVGIVLLIACSNVANLLMARAAARRQEMVVRLALGANRKRLLRQLLTESVLLAGISGAAGLFVAYAGLHLLFSALPLAANFTQPKFDVRVFTFALAVSLASAFLFGTAPAFRASNVELAGTLKEETRTMGRSRGRVTLANGLLVGQVAFSFLLLVTACLFLRSIARAYTIDPGFQTAHLAIFATSPGQAGYGKAQTQAFYKDVRERTERIPGVESVSWASSWPLWARLVNGLEVEGRQARSQADKIAAIINTVDRNYFETAGVALLAGRGITALDQDNSMPVAIVNEKLAHDYWPGQAALGKRVRLPGETQFRQVIGVARTANYTAWAEPPQPCVYVPLTQNFSDGMMLYIRSKGSPQPLIEPIEQQLRAAGPHVMISSQTGPEIIKHGLFFTEAGVALLIVFGFLALALASIGLYGILAYAVNERKREIGLRMALGAGRATVLQLILRQGMSLVLIGVLIGFLAALLVSRLLSKLLYGVSASDPLSLAGAAVVLLSVALLACYLPARGASRVDPLVALREG